MFIVQQENQTVVAHEGQFSSKYTYFLIIGLWSSLKQWLGARTANLMTIIK